jgi:hypothetical protein
MKKLITHFNSKNLKQIKLMADAENDESMEDLWTTITNAGATVREAGKSPINNNYYVSGEMKGSLIQIEQLIKKGWQWK